MEPEHDEAAIEPIELGAVTEETLGRYGPPVETIGLLFDAGISDE
jgi:hypothetical protein